MSLVIPEFNLQSFNTLAVPCIAAWYISVSDEIELKKAIEFAKEKSLKLLVLGGGSNVILPEYFDGLAIHVRTQGISIISQTENEVVLGVAAGENWHDFVMWCLTNNFYGLENLALIPGTVGAAPIQNIGAYGVEVKDFIAEVKVIERQSLLPITFVNEACQFDYRESIFKSENLDKYIVTSVVFKLSKVAAVNITYPALINAINDMFGQGHISTPLDVADAVIAVRESKLPNPQDIPNVGSFFKNPIVERRDYERLVVVHPKMPHFPAKNGAVKLAAGWLIDQAGWRGRALNGAAVHEKQALVLTNPQRKSAETVLRLAQEIVIDVHKKFGVMLEAEPRTYS